MSNEDISEDDRFVSVKLIRIKSDIISYLTVDFNHSKTKEQIRKEFSGWEILCLAAEL